MNGTARPRRVAPGLFAWLLLAGVGSVAALDPAVRDARPSPTLTPADVVRIQLEALRSNGAGDQGIAVAFRFASPANRRSTGPLPRFAAMIKDGPYALMLRFADASFGPVTREGRSASQQVTLVAPGERPVTYVFRLTRQRAPGPLNECWMTDAVTVHPYSGSQA